MLNDVLMTYVMYDFDLGYVQGKFESSKMNSERAVIHDLAERLLSLDGNASV